MVKETAGLADSTKQAPVRTGISLIPLDEHGRAQEEPVDYDDATLWRPAESEPSAIEGFVAVRGETYNFAGTFIEDDAAKSSVTADVEIPALALA